MRRKPWWTRLHQSPAYKHHWGCQEAGLQTLNSTLDNLMMLNASSEANLAFDLS